MFSGETVGDLEVTPAAAAIARYLGIDLSPEGKAARYKKGLNVIITGPPLSGKSFQAKVCNRLSVRKTLAIRRQ